MGLINYPSRRHVNRNALTQDSPPSLRIRWLSTKRLLISPQPLRRCKFHVARALSMADSSISGVFIISLNAEGLVEAEAPALKGDTLPAPPISGNELLVAAERDAWTTVEGRLDSFGCCSTVNLRKESTPSAESNRRTSWYFREGSWARRGEEMM